MENNSVYKKQREILSLFAFCPKINTIDLYNKKTAVLSQLVEFVI